MLDHCLRLLSIYNYYTVYFLCCIKHNTYFNLSYTPSPAVPDSLA